MAETLRETAAALSLDASNFSRNMRTVNWQIKEAGSGFRFAGAGVENCEKTITGAESRQSHAGIEAHLAAGCIVHLAVSGSLS